MAGLEVLFASAAPTITCAQDALVCFLHWELVMRGYHCVGAGEQVRQGAGSELGWRGEGVFRPNPEDRRPGAELCPYPHPSPGFMTPLVQPAVREVLCCPNSAQSTSAQLC